MKALIVVLTIFSGLWLCQSSPSNELDEERILDEIRLTHLSEYVSGYTMFGKPEQELISYVKRYTVASIYPPGVDPAECRQVVACYSRHRSAGFLLFSKSDTGWVVADEIVAPVPLKFEFLDVNCDGLLDVILDGQTKRNPGLYPALMVQIRNDSLIYLTSKNHSRWLLRGKGGKGRIKEVVLKDVDEDCDLDMTLTVNALFWANEDEEREVKYLFDQDAQEYRVQINWSDFRISHEMAQLCEQFIPENIKQSVLDAPWILNNVPLVFNYRMYSNSELSAGDTTAIIICGDSERWMGLLSKQDGVWRLQDEVLGLSTSGLALDDIDCDGANEIIVRYLVGTHTAECLDIVKIQDSRLVLITPTVDHSPCGYGMQLQDLDGDCIKEIEVYHGGYNKGGYDYHLIYKLNQETGMYNLSSKEELR